MKRDQVIDFKVTFNSESGRRCLAYLEKKFHFLSSTAVHDQTGRVDTARMALSEGERSVILFIKKQLAAELKPEPTEKGDKE